MKPEALALQCVQTIQQQPTLPFIVVIGKLPVKGWPKGECIGSDSRGRFYSYDARAILGRLVAQGVVRMQTVDATGAVTVEIDTHPGTFVISPEHSGEVYQVARKEAQRINAPRKNGKTKLQGY